MSHAVFLRCPISVAEKIRNAIRKENDSRASKGLEPFAIYKGAPCLPPWFARAGERQASALARVDERALGKWPGAVLEVGGREPTLNVNFDIDEDLAARVVTVIHQLNRALAPREPICLRSGQPSLPQFFLRAGLVDLQREEAGERDAPVATPRAALYPPGTAGHAICEQVRRLLAKRPRRAPSLTKACHEFPLLQVSQAIAAMCEAKEIEEAAGYLRLVRA